jgi:hypothetical protein
MNRRHKIFVGVPLSVLVIVGIVMLVVNQQRMQQIQQISEMANDDGMRKFQ